MKKKNKNKDILDVEELKNENKLLKARCMELETQLSNILSIIKYMIEVESRNNEANDIMERVVSQTILRTLMSIYTAIRAALMEETK